MCERDLVSSGERRLVAALFLPGAIIALKRSRRSGVPSNTRRQFVRVDIGAMIDSIGVSFPVCLKDVFISRFATATGDQMRPILSGTSSFRCVLLNENLCVDVKAALVSFPVLCYHTQTLLKRDLVRISQISSLKPACGLDELTEANLKFVSICTSPQRSSFLRVDREFAGEVAAGKLSESGTTALAVAVMGSRLVVANAGDSRAVLCRDGQAQDLTVDHKPSSERERQRIEAAGGIVDPDGYLNGELSVSRAVGDFHYPHLKIANGVGPLTAEPDVSELCLEDDCEFLVIASDGALEAMTSQKLVDIVRGELRRSNDPQRASQAVVRLQNSARRSHCTLFCVCVPVIVSAHLGPPLGIRRRRHRQWC